jgi:hypothetical protein
VDAAEADPLGQRVVAKKQKYSYTWLMINPPLSVEQKSRAAVSAVCRGAKGGAKFFQTKIQRNSLKMLDSDERIQGNPSFSNPQNQRFSRPNGPIPRKPKPAQPGRESRPPRSQSSNYQNINVY